ncbi:MAG TPA: LptF/LptG family permease [Candidatus Sulfopaludibacter sp.]|nr:LptF/LptG family permease [Candidatus Sulfopaludibacter sp.]
MLRLLGRYVFREILTSAVLGTMLATFVIYLRGADALFTLLVSSTNVTAKIVVQLFAWAIPPVLPLTIPFGVLVGILIGLGRMASDGEIVAMRAAGVSSRKVILPVLVFASLGMGVAALASLRLAPLAYRVTLDLRNELLKQQLSADVEPRIFIDNFPNKIVYVGDVRNAGGPSLWTHVFIADVTPPEQRTTGMKDKANGPVVTVAREAIAVSDAAHNRIQLSMSDVANHEMGKDDYANDSRYVHIVQRLEANPPRQESLRSQAMNTRALLAYPRTGPDWIEVQTELHRRFANPFACIVLAMVGIPLGISTRKGGKSAGYIIAVFLGFFCYHLSSLTLIGIATKQHSLPIPVAVWLPDAAFFLVGLIFLYRMELPGDHDLLASFQGFFARLAARIKPKPGAPTESKQSWRPFLLPQIVDTYILSGFLFYVSVVLASLVSMILVYNFFELMGDMFRNKIAFSTMLEYLFFLTPQLIYDMVPVSVLVAVLVHLTVLSRQNEVTAFKACGVSLYRLAMPILLGSAVFCGGLFAFNYQYVPAAYLRQDALRDLIKGRVTKQSWQLTDRKWIMGNDSRIYYYRYFDTTAAAMSDVYVFDLEPTTFRLMREIVAERATWSPVGHTWLFENGWSCTFEGANCTKYNNFKRGSGKSESVTFPELTEPPEHFLKEPPRGQQMNFLELDRYIADLAKSGIGTTKLEVQFYRKFSVPVFPIIMALIAVPFGFIVGKRGAMTGIGVSLVIGLGYWATNTLFEKLGDVRLLPPTMAAWSPDLVFALIGLYLFLRMRS